MKCRFCKSRFSGGQKKPQQGTLSVVLPHLLLPALLQKPVGEFFLIFGREILVRNLAGTLRNFSDPQLGCRKWGCNKWGPKVANPPACCKSLFGPFGPKSPEKVYVGPFFKCVLSQEMRHIIFFLGAPFGWGPKSLC